MYDQTLNKYKSINLGFGSGSLYSYGCYLFSLAWGLNRRGIPFTPEGLNQKLKDLNLWTGEYRNYIDVAKLHIVFPEVFSGFQQVDSFTVQQIDDFIKAGKIVVAKVKAEPIGGTGTHFVEVDHVENGVSIINDPWAGVQQPVTTRYRYYGNLLSLRVFTIKKPNNGGSMAIMYGEPNKYDLTNQDSMKIAVDHLNMILTGKYIARSEADRIVSEANKAADAKWNEQERRHVEELNKVKEQAKTEVATAIDKANSEAEAKVAASFEAHEKTVKSLYDKLEDLRKQLILVAGIDPASSLNDAVSALKELINQPINNDQPSSGLLDRLPTGFEIDTVTLKKVA